MNLPLFQITPNVLVSRIKWMLGLFLKNRKRIPQNLIVFRDGVSEGFYDKVRKREREREREREGKRERGV